MRGGKRRQKEGMKGMCKEGRRMSHYHLHITSRERLCERKVRKGKQEEENEYDKHLNNQEHTHCLSLAVYIFFSLCLQRHSTIPLLHIKHTRSIPILPIFLMQELTSIFTLSFHTLVNSGTLAGGKTDKGRVLCLFFHLPIT